MHFPTCKVEKYILWLASKHIADQQGKAASAKYPTSIY